MAKSAKSNSVFDVTGIIPEQKGRKEQTTNINNKHKQQITGFNLGKPEKEIKSKRVNLVLQPSLYEKAQNVAKANGISFNEMVTQMLQQVTKIEADPGQMTIDDIE